MTRQEIKALMAIGLVQGWRGWQKKAYYTILEAILMAGLYPASTNNLASSLIMFLGAVLWMAFLPHH